MRLTITVVLLTISTASWGQAETKNAPYSEPPSSGPATGDKTEHIQ